MDNYKHFKKPKIRVLNEKGVWIRKCPHCGSSRLRRAIDNGFECLRCFYINKRRLTLDSKEVGRVSYIEYGTDTKEKI